MKTIYKLLLLLLPLFGFTQTETVIDFNSSVITNSYIIDKGAKINLSFVAKNDTYLSVSYVKDYNPQGTLVIPDANAAGVTSMGTPTSPILMTFAANTKYTFTVKAFKKTDNTLIDTHTIEFVSRSKWYWTPTFGVSMVSLVKRDTYKSVLNADGADPATYTIVRDGSQKHFDAIPSVMFTYSKLEQDFSWGVTGGLGTDFETLSTFVGLSAVVGQNFVLTAGLAFHEQLRLNSNYEEEQVINTDLNFEELNTAYHRFNPFISLTYRLNSNPYKK
ncbi:hypothetical protein M0G43_08450 [Subsaxibacter sp. CAU 1640]|uniref:hypothetical protein n=1 Tax=Subsaxibacter sp. CAU 1640 TaxID=2933271 RepID=UPI002004326D|nr:hypothetical protein [Subsaxibacter sp. CAU 1640]MCK7590600.1 hypothetical protein [Subsaxibacter sp. CAU 1640]